MSFSAFFFERNKAFAALLSAMRVSDKGFFMYAINKL
ncbi:hypothetical protein APX70_05751 [Pseudomonas syringae pv. maculicola]|uniref:Uncharacterized protein n=1 Tax=Pseudomonas syringae pv. maculicola TaxID=59511 RepID=A0A3M2V3L8_PSEYM|nr:hypothetical protein APX70_05751 [Pseudomonas syringae pv. maculicola]